MSPAAWVETVRANPCPDADGLFLSCANTTHIEITEQLERELAKPVVNSNQATIWKCLHAIKGRLGGMRWNGDLGSLMSH